MKKVVLASLSVLALLTVAACSDSTDNTTTQSTTPPPVEQTQPADPNAPAVTPTPESGTGGETQASPQPVEPVQPAPAQ